MKRLPLPFVMLAACALWGIALAQQTPNRITLDVLEPAERGLVVKDFPVTTGIVFPDGALAALPGGRVVDDRGTEIPFDARATGWWSPEKDRIKWLLVLFKADADRTYFFEVGAVARPAQGAPLAIERDGVIVVSTGPLAARMSSASDRFFDDLTLNGRKVLSGFNGFILVTDDGKTQAPTTTRSRRLEIEESTPLKAVIKASALLAGPDAEPVARADVRYQFFKGESFIRVYHTLTWMVKDPAFGAREMSLRLRPDLGPGGTVRIGVSDLNGRTIEVAREAGTQVLAHQDRATHFTATLNGKPLGEGGRLGGWIAAEDAAGAGVAVSLRNLWQEFPKALALEAGELRAYFWPAVGRRLSFLPEAVMPPNYYLSAEWKKYSWSKEAGHFIHEYADNPYFLHTAEGAAKTHELTLFFYDKSSLRTAAQINSLTQRPFIVRQDPVSAMRVPFMGLDIMPRDPQKYPDIERAADQIGRMALARWPVTNDYGFFQFGMMRWHTPGEGLYRWYDGAQYDQQMIPWLLYQRGGDRTYYEDGEATARFLMDIGVNHYNTRGYSAGYVAPASAMPFPWAPLAAGKHMKIHFLSAYYHLTGYERAREVMLEVIRGAKDHTEKASDALKAQLKGRELYNMNVFWANAYDETFDPATKAVARKMLDLTLDEEYHPGYNAFRTPQVYLYLGLIAQDALWSDKRAREIMLKALAGGGYPEMQDGGISSVADAIGCNWAYGVTGDARFARAGWGVASVLADLVPDHDWTASTVPPYPWGGVEMLHTRLLPILAGASTSARSGASLSLPPASRDCYISLDLTAEKKPGSGRAFVRPRRDGDLILRVLLRDRWEGQIPEVTVAAFGPDDRKVAETHISQIAGMFVPESIPTRFYIPSDSRNGTVTIPNARAGDTYRIDLRGGNDKTLVLLLADAAIVHDVGGMLDLYNQAGQYWAGTRAWFRTTQDVVQLRNAHQAPCTVRDGETWAVLYRSTLNAPATCDIKTGKDRLICLTIRGRVNYVQLAGVCPYVSASREAWFDPTAPHGGERLP